MQSNNAVLRKKSVKAKVAAWATLNHIIRRVTVGRISLYIPYPDVLPVVNCETLKQEMQSVWSSI